MRKIILLLTHCFIIFAVSAQQVKLYTNRHFDFAAHFGTITNTGDSIGSYSSGGGCYVDSIVILGKNDRSHIQTIIAEENTYPCNDTNNNPLFIEDMNFDGYEDVSIQQFLPAAPNIPSFYWIYDTTEKQFKRDYELEKITSAEFDHKNKLITSSWRGSASSYGTDTYKFINGKLTLIKKVTEDADEHDQGYKIVVTRKLIKGKMTIVSRKKEKW